MKLGIVGSEGAKFTPETEDLARRYIRFFIHRHQPTHVVSGKCHLGGIDIWAVQEARWLGCEIIEHPPLNLQWSTGYKPRNIQIAKNSDHVVCITLKELPIHYRGMRFKLCYHCGTKDHIKSGGCWTVKYAKTIGKTGEIVTI